jgi:hypothetical protein
MDMEERHSPDEQRHPEWRREDKQTGDSKQRKP